MCGCCIVAAVCVRRTEDHARSAQQCDLVLCVISSAHTSLSLNPKKIHKKASSKLETQTAKLKARR